jgi:hypothetical protein
MSGAPVIMRENTHYLAENGEIKAQASVIRWIGIYASRPNITVSLSIKEDDARPEIGFFYKSGYVEETMKGLIRGPRFGELP